ncbi:MAG: methyltransferase domain-containing protein [Candidatus Omnitrophica bacterium]|nr:methyltransferase domain-containing protein [Candidatus Omnitrophota bacterium]
MKEKVIKYFDDQAVEYNGKYGRINDLRSFIFAERKRIVLTMLGADRKRILDIGCGPGVYTDELSGRCGRLYGVDVSSEMIAIANGKKFRNAEFSVGNIEKLGFQDGFFDAVVCAGVLEYLDNVEAGIREVARVTGKNGIAIFTAPNASSITNKLDYYLRAFLKVSRKIIKADISGSFMNYDFEPKLLCGKELELLLKKYGFRVERTVFHVFRLSLLNRINPRLSLYLSKKLNFVSSRFLAINYVVKAVKDGAAR